MDERDGRFDEWVRVRGDYVRDGGPAWRQTGRTKAVCDAAVAAARSSRQRVLILALCERACEEIRKSVTKITAFTGGSQSVDIYADVLPVRDYIHERGAKYAAIFVDHCAWEFAPVDTARAILHYATGDNVKQQPHGQQAMVSQRQR